MIVRIEFSGRYGESNMLNKEKLDELIDFLGEDVNVEQMKIGGIGKPTSKSYGETFDEAEAEKDSKKLVKPADMYEISESKTFLVDFEAFTERYPNLRVTVRGKPKSIGKDNLSMLGEMRNISGKIEAAMSKFDKQVQFNERCDVHIPNLGLMNINKLGYATDYCTEQLQNHLDKGWRILAICPQPDQRRPDYILGMSVINENDSVEVVQFV